MDHTDYVGRVDVRPRLNDDEAAAVARFARSRTNGCSWTPCPDGCCLGLGQPARPGVAGDVAALPAHRRARDRASARRRPGRVPATHRGAVLGHGREQPGAREGAARREHIAGKPRSGVRRSGPAPRSSTSPPAGPPAGEVGQTPARSLSVGEHVVDLAPEGQVPLVVEQVRPRGRHVRSPATRRARAAPSRPAAVPDRHRDGDVADVEAPAPDDAPGRRRASRPRPAPGPCGRTRRQYVGELAGQERRVDRRQQAAQCRRRGPRPERGSSGPGVLLAQERGGTSSPPAPRPRTRRRSPGHAVVPVEPVGVVRRHASRASWPRRQRPGRIAAQASARGPPPDQPRVTNSSMPRWCSSASTSTTSSAIRGPRSENGHGVEPPYPGRE